MAGEVELWCSLPRRFRTAFGGPDGSIPPCDVLAYLFESEEDLAHVLAKYCAAQDPNSQQAHAKALWLLQGLAQSRIKQVQRRRALTPPAQQALHVLMKRRCCEQATREFSLEWLIAKSGAIQRRRVWSSRKSKMISDKTCGLLRRDIEQQEVQRWRQELVLLAREASLPICTQTALATNPAAAIEAAVGAARASTIRSRVREWRRIRAYCLATTERAWPKHVGVVLDYLHERRLEPCAPSVPNAFLKCLGFVERAGGVPAAERWSNMQVVKNTVNQMTTELEAGAPQRKHPCSP